MQASEQQAWLDCLTLSEAACQAARAQYWDEALALGARLFAMQASLPPVATLTLDAQERQALRETVSAVQANIMEASRLLRAERDVLSAEMQLLRTQNRVLDAYSKGA